jgi:hypothetical protein
MKKTVVVILLVVAALAVLATGVAVAQTRQPPTPGSGAGMGLGSGRGPMRAFAANGAEGPLHEYMVKAMADALGISASDFEARRDAGETAYQIALGLGISADKIPTLLSDARSKALDAAVADKAITQAQADWMKSRGAGMGPANCDGTGQPLGARMGSGWRFQQTSP